MIKTEIYNSIYVASKYITIEIDDDICFNGATEIEIERKEKTSTRIKFVFVFVPLHIRVQNLHDRWPMPFLDRFPDQMYSKRHGYPREVE